MDSGALVLAQKHWLMPVTWAPCCAPPGLSPHQDAITLVVSSGLLHGGTYPEQHDVVVFVYTAVSPRQDSELSHLCVPCPHRGCWAGAQCASGTTWPGQAQGMSIARQRATFHHLLLPPLS